MYGDLEEKQEESLFLREVQLVLLRAQKMPCKSAGEGAKEGGGGNPKADGRKIVFVNGTVTKGGGKFPKFRGHSLRIAPSVSTPAD